MSTSQAAAIPMQYTSVAPSSSAPAVTFTQQLTVQTIPVNFAGVPADFAGQTTGIASNFTVGGWVRASFNPPAADGPYVFLAGGQFGISYSSTGIVTAGFLDQGNSSSQPVESSIPIADGQWHFIAASYQQIDTASVSGAAPSGELNLYIDGDLLDVVTVTNFPTSALSGLTLGDSCPAGWSIDFGAWLVWSVPETGEVMDVPQWGAPTGSGLVEGLAVALDFANGAPQDSSGNNVQFTFGAQNSNTPCLQLTGGQSAAVPSTAGINPGGVGGDFTVMGWIGLPTQDGGWVNLLQNTFSNGNTLSVGLNIDGTGGCLAVFINLTDSGGSNNIFYVNSEGFPPQTWTFVTVTYQASGNLIALYQNGNRLAIGPTGGAVDLPENASQQILIGASATNAGSPPNANLQGVSVWNMALAAEQVAQAVTSADPTTVAVDPIGATACQVFFSLTTPAPQGLTDPITGAVLATEGIVGNVSTPVAQSQSAVAARSARPSPASADGGIRFMRAQDYLALASKLGIDPSAQPSASTEADPEFQANVAWYEQVLKDVPPKLAARLRDRFRRNLNTGLQLARLSPGIGQFSLDSANGAPALRYHDAAGQHTIPGPWTDLQFPSGGTSPPSQISLAATIVLDFVALLFALLPLPTSVNLAWFPRTVVIRFGQGVATVSLAGSPYSAGVTVMSALLSVLLFSGLAACIISSALSSMGVWGWGFWFQVATYACSLALMITPGGWATVIARLALLAASIGALVSAVQQYQRYYPAATAATA